MAPNETPEQRLEQSWHANAAAWIETVRAGQIESRRVATDQAILAAAIERRPRKVLDLGCGEGWLARALADRGVDVVGVDGAAPLIAAASASGGGRFVNASYAELIADPNRAGTGFDLVIANFALMDADIVPLLRALRATMTKDALVLIQTLHPLAAGPPYQDGWRTEAFDGFGEHAWTPMPWYFRTLASWIGVLRDSGLMLADLAEPRHPDDGRPLALLLKAVRDDR